MIAAPFPHRLARLLAVALLALLAQAGAVWAHAALNAADPPDGAVLETAPKLYALTFSEPVSPLALRLVTPDGSALTLERFAVKGNVVEIEAPDDLRPGTHILNWRVTSDDGHPVAGSLVFSIGAASLRSPAPEEQVDRTVRGWLWASKVALYAGLFIGVGGVFARRILIPEADVGGGVMAVALALGVAAAIVSLGFQGLDALGAQVADLAGPAVWAAGFGTSYGSTVIAALAAFALAVGALALGGFAATAVAVAAWLLTGAALALSGHAGAASPQWLMRSAVFLHAGAIAIWIGALAPLGLALRANRPGATQALRRFSRVIPVIVAILVLAGVVLAAAQVREPAALLSTAYGRVFLIKLALLCGLFLLAAFNRWLLTTPAATGDARATRRLVRSIAAETLIVFLIFGATAAWRFTPPPRVLAAPATTHIHTDRAMAEITATPGRAGTVDLSAMVMTGEFGPLDAKEVTFFFSNSAAGVEPFHRRAEKAGDGSWRAGGVILPLPGEWTVRVDVLISDFEIARLEGRIRIRP